MYYKFTNKIRLITINVISEVPHPSCPKLNIHLPSLSANHDLISSQRVACLSSNLLKFQSSCFAIMVQLSLRMRSECISQDPPCIVALLLIEIADSEGIPFAWLGSPARHSDESWCAYFLSPTFRLVPPPDCIPLTCF